MGVVGVGVGRWWVWGDTVTSQLEAAASNRY